MATILNELDVRLQATAPRIISTFTPLEGSALVFIKTKNLTTIAPTSITLTADLVEFTSPTVVWEYSVPSAPATWTSIGAGTTSGTAPTKINQITISSASFVTHKGATDTKVIYRSTVTQATWEPVVNKIEVLYSALADDSAVILFSKESVLLPTTALDVVTYTGSGVSIDVNVGGTALTYNTVGANTYNVSAAVTSGTITIGTPTTSTNTRIYPDASALAAGLSSTAIITFTITVRNSENVATVYTRNQYFSKLTTSGTTTTFRYLSIDKPTIIKQSESASLSGSHSTTTVTGYVKIGDTAPTIGNWLTVQYGGGSESARVANTITTSISDGAGISDVTFKMYDAATAGNLVDLEIIPVLFKNPSTIVVNLSNDAMSIPTDSAGGSGVYTNSGTEVHVYQGTTELTYDGIGTTAGTWRFTSGTLPVGTGITASASITDSGVYATIGAHSAMTTPTAIVTYSITGTNLQGASFTTTKIQGFAKAVGGVAGTNGTRTAILDVYQSSSSVPTLFPVGNSVYTWATAQFTAPGTLNGWSLTPTTPTIGQTLYIARTIYADSLTTTTTSVTWSAASAIAVGSAGANGTRLGVLEVYQWAVSTPTSYPSGTSTYTWATGAFTAPSTPNGWSLLPGVAVTGNTLWGITATVSDSLTTSTSSATWSSSTVYAVGAAGSNGATGAPGATGSPGADGAKAITVSCFIWGNAGTPAVPTQAFTLTWPSTVGAYPSGWSAAAPASPGSGYVLYMLSLIVSATASASTTATNWNGGTIGSIGYRTDGSIGPQGDGARIAYTKSTIASPSGTTTSTGTSSLPATSSFGLTGSVFSTSPVALLTGDFLYQTDGIYVVGTNTTTWSTPYLSNLKVGSLSALTSNLGSVDIASGGYVRSGKTDSTSTTAGFFLGNEGGTHKFKIGSASDTSYLLWDGTNLKMVGPTLDLTADISITKPATSNFTGGIGLGSKGLEIKSSDNTTGVFNGVALIANNTSYNNKAALIVSTTGGAQTDVTLYPGPSGTATGSLGGSLETRTAIFSGNTGGTTSFRGLGPLDLRSVLSTVDIVSPSSVTTTAGTTISLTAGGIVSINAGGANYVGFNTSGTGRVLVEASFLRPFGDNLIGLGASGFRWSTLAVAGAFNWGGYSISAPTGSTATFLRNDGTWTTPAGGGTVTAVTGTAPVVSSGGTAPIISMGAASSGVAGHMTGAYATKLDGIATGATNYTHPANHLPSIITQDASNRFVTEAQISSWNSRGFGSVTNVTSGSASITVTSGSATPNITISTAGGASNGILTSTDWNTFNNKQTALGFTPVQQGGGTGQLTNKLYMGWDGGDIRLQVDASNFSSNWPLRAKALHDSTNTYQFTGTVSSGSGTPSFVTLKPGASNNNTWLNIVVSGTSYWIPVWAN